MIHEIRLTHQEIQTIISQLGEQHTVSRVLLDFIVNQQNPEEIWISLALFASPEQVMELVVLSRENVRFAVNPLVYQGVRISRGDIPDFAFYQLFELYEHDDNKLADRSYTGELFLDAYKLAHLTFRDIKQAAWAFGATGKYHSSQVGTDLMMAIFDYYSSVGK